MALLTRTRCLGLDQSFLESDEIDKILINVRLVRNGPVLVPLFVHEYKNLAYLETLIICELPIFQIAKARYNHFVNKIGKVGNYDEEYFPYRTFLHRSDIIVQRQSLSDIIEESRLRWGHCRYLVQDFFVGGETVVYQVSCIACLQ